MMPSLFAFLLGTQASLILWFPSNPTPLGTSSCSGSISTTGSGLPPLCGLQCLRSCLRACQLLHTTFHQSCLGNSMRSPPHLLHSTMPPPDQHLHPQGLSIPMTQTLTLNIHPLKLPQVIQPSRFTCRP